MAHLLQNQANRLTEARRLAEEALAIKQTLDPAAAQIWTTYTVLAKIAEQEGKTTEALGFHRQAAEVRINLMLKNTR